MKPLKPFLFAAFIALCCCASAVRAQDLHTHEHDAAEKVGRVNFSVSCNAPARAEFGRAIAMLHSFWYEESGSAFGDIVKKDPRCAMGYWGVALSLYHPLWEQPSPEALRDGWAAVEKAKALGAKTARERDYIAAIESFYAVEKRDYRTRVLSYERAMEQLYVHHPEDKEAGVFYALALIATAQALPTDKTYTREKKAAEILNRALAKEPHHPGVVHYLIHAYDSPALASLALPAAQAYAKIAPSVPHALHMPSHIFTRLGLWQESINSNLASEAAAKDYAVRTRMDGAWDEQLHAMDYLMYAYLQLAQDAKAKGILDELNLIRKTNAETFKVAYAFAAIPARYAIERRQWSEAASLELRPQEFPWNRSPWAEAIVHFARGLGAARKGDVAGARKEMDKLAGIQKALAGATGYDWTTQVEIQRRAIAAWLAHAEGKDQEAVTHMRSAADLEDTTDKHPVTPGPIVSARELLGELLAELGQPAEAMKEFEISLRAAPNRFNGVYGAAHAAELAGNRQKAQVYYEKLVMLCAAADNTRVELQQAKAFLANKP